MKFSELGLSETLLKAVEDAGYTEPTPIQAAAIPHALKGRDVLGVAQTGTGKTASFTLPMIEMLARGRAKARMPRSLILEPTRELAAQVADNFETYGKNHKLSMALLIGGVSFADQDRLLTQGVDVLIATPGRLLDHFERGKLLLSGVQVLVVDEADRMLDMGFIPDIERIFKLTPFTRQTLFFSATMPPEIQRLTTQFLHNPERVEVSRPATTATTVTQRKIRLRSNDPKSKRAALRAAIDKSGVRTAIVFCNRKREVDVVAKSLARHGYAAAPIHGDLPQSVRTATLKKFKDGDINILVASDVAARGLDIHDISHIFNFGVPRHPDDYVHRIGRTGRAGRSGDAVTLVSPEDAKSWSAVETLIKTEVADFEGVEVEAEAPSAAAEDDRAPSGRSSRRRGGRSSSKQPTREAAEEVAAVPKPKAETAKSESRSKNRSEDRSSGNRKDRKREVGLGEHTPAFLLRPGVNRK
ncbi:MAG: DEAD/DEAH box helicase [Maricaulaceae bacterium]|jgi:superfamily II DNA/RNA helicase